jgi:hypothetical protein
MRAENLSKSLNSLDFQHALHAHHTNNHTRSNDCFWNSPKTLQSANSSDFVVTSYAHSLGLLFLMPMKSSGTMTERMRYRSLP